MSRYMCKWFLIGVIVIWFLSANTIMGKIYNYNRVTIEKDPILEQEQQLPSMYSIDAFNMEENLFNLVNISGWAVCPTSENEDNQVTNILLESDKTSYMIKTEKQRRVDIKEILRNNGGFQIGDMHGFFVTFCPYVIKDGEYQVYLACYENGQIVGKEAAGYSLDKKNGKIEIRESTSQLLSDIPMNNVKVANIRRNTDCIGVQNDYFIIKGWMFIVSEDVANQEKIVEIISDSGKVMRYKAEIHSRVDLHEQTGLKNCTTAGFVCRIPYKDLKEFDKVELNYYILESGQLYTSGDKEIFTFKENDNEH